MSLISDKLFYDALKEDEAIIQATDGRIYNTVYPEENTEAEKIPYIIIFHEGVTNSAESKDCGPEGTRDVETIRLFIVADERKDLAELSTMVRKCIREASDDWYMYDYQFSAGPVAFDYDKPCHYQSFTYQCETPNE